MLTTKEIYILLEALTHQHGRGYSDDPEIGHLQAKLSIMGEVASQRESVMENDDATK